MKRLQRPQVAETPTRKNGREGIHKGDENQSNNQTMKNKWRSSEGVP